MKFLLFILSISWLTLLNAQNKSTARKEDHHLKEEQHKSGPHGGMHYRKSGGKYQRIVQEYLDPQRKSMNQQLRQIESTMKKNMQIFAAERRQIKNLNSLAAKEKSKDKVNAACEEIKDAINKFQAQISQTIEEVEVIYSEE